MFLFGLVGKNFKKYVDKNFLFCYNDNCQEDNQLNFESEVFKMNELDYRMDYEDRKKYVYDLALEKLEEDDEIFCEAVQGLSSYNGFVEEECFPMDELGELYGHMNLGDFLNHITSDFDHNDNYFYETIYGLESCDDVAEHYRDCVTNEEVLNELIDYYNHVSLSDTTFDGLVEVLYNADFGIDYDWEWYEDMDDDEVPEETDDEFKERIDNL